MSIQTANQISDTWSDTLLNFSPKIKKCQEFKRLKNFFQPFYIQR